MEWYEIVNMKCNFAWFRKISKRFEFLALMEHMILFDINRICDYLPLFKSKKKKCIQKIQILAKILNWSVEN